MFLRELAMHGIVARAARAASPAAGSRGAVQSFRDHRIRDRDFAQAWEEAKEQARGNVEAEIHRRAVEGYEEPIFGGPHREKIVGTVKRYSDRLLELRAKALMPEYRDHSKVDLNTARGDADLDATMRLLTLEELNQLEKLFTKIDERAKR